MQSEIIDTKETPMYFSVDKRGKVQRKKRLIIDIMLLSINKLSTLLRRSAERLSIIAKIVKLVFLSILFFGCSGIYDFGSDIDKVFESKVVVNSLICPDSTIRVSIYRTKPVGSQEAFNPVDADMELFEDNLLVFSGQSVNGVVSTDIYPIECKEYRIELIVDGEKEISATTSIPQKSDMTFVHRTKFIKDRQLGYVLADVSAISIPDNIRAVWISGFYRMSDGLTYEPVWSNDLFSVSPYIDRINLASDPMDVPLRESNWIYEGNFIRITKANTPLITPFTFSYGVFLKTYIYPENIEYASEPEEYFLENIIIRLISPSEEYDRYTRTAYKQDNLIYGSPFGSDPVHVYSNINNGIGIFAGYNINNITIRVDNPHDDI